MPKTQRIHSLDALRAMMMLLGIIIHGAETYSNSTDLIWPRDPHSTHRFFTYLSSIIHIFRMPLFFLISGFFASMLYYQRSPSVMITQRLKRVILPFLIFLLLLHPIIHHSYAFMIESFDSKGFQNTAFKWIPNISYHLWFLYYLILITAITAVLATALRAFPKVGVAIHKGFERGMQQQIVFTLFLSIILFFLLVWMWDFWAPTPISLLPDVKVLSFYLVFYLFGWVLFKSNDKLYLFKKYDKIFLTIAFAVYTLKFVYIKYFNEVLYGALNTIIGWFFIFGFIGIFLRYLDSESKFRRYLSDSSYWVYLIHLPFTLIVPALIVDWIPIAGVKFSIVILVTTVISFASYHYLVRDTFIGQFLNGRKYK